MASNERTYRGVGVEERRADRRRQLLDAVTESVGQGGVVATTIDGVCARAGLTKRYFYEAFTGLDEALACVLDDLLSGALERMRVAVRRPGLSHEHRVQDIVQTLVDSLTADVGLARLYVEAPAHPVLRARRDAAVATFSTFLQTEGLEFARRSRPTVRRDLAVWIVVAGTTDLVTSWLAGTVEADSTAMVRTIAATGLAVAAGV